MNLLFQPLIISKTGDLIIQDFLNHAISFFFNELNLFRRENESEDFGEWFSERTLLSLFFNGLVRGDNQGNYTSVQEYCVGGVGRCDGFVSFAKNVILIESKMHRYVRPLQLDHFTNIERWIEWDETIIRKQLSKYFDAERSYFTKGYNKCYLLTLVFKIIKENPQQHYENAFKYLLPDHSNKYSRTWYYTVGFSNEPVGDAKNGIEVYGTIEQAQSKIS